MERELQDVKSLSPDEINEMEERRVARLNEAGIDEQEVLKSAGNNLNIWNSYFNENIVRGKDDMNFVLRDQWTAVERSEFTRLFKPAMTFNKLYDPIKKIVGEQRKNKPDLIVRSLTGKATQEDLNLRGDLVRTISYQSQNDLVYQTAFKNALMMGFGAFQICLDYESPMSFNRVIRYDIIPDATRTGFDPTALKPHKGDGNWCSRSFVFSRDEFFATYPYVTNPVSFIDPYMLLDFQWTTRDTVVVQDYFVKEWFPVIIYRLSNGQVVTGEQWEDLQKKFKLNQELAESTKVVGDIIKNDIPKIIDERQTQDYRIMHYRMLQNQIIDFSLWPSKHLPIIFVDGDSYFIEGRQYTKSFIHEARDAQKFINYVGSEIAGEIKNRRREQWLVTPDNIAGFEQDWRNPEVQVAALRARPDQKTGMMPQKMPQWELSQSLMANFQRGTQDIREILGFSEQEALQGKDISGKARRERKLEGSMSAYIFYDNLNQALEQGGRVVLDLVPFIIGQDERHMVLSKKDGRTESITLNKRISDDQIENQILPGDYDIEIDTGPSFAVQKDVALEFLQQTLQAFPQAFPLVADLWAKNLDVQFMPQIAERFKSMVPPEVLAKEEGKEVPPKGPSPEEMMQHQAMAMNEQKMKIEEQALMERAEELAIRKQKHEIEKVEMLLKAQQAQEKLGLDHQKNMIDASKASRDFEHKIATILSDLHKHHNPNKPNHAA